MRIRFAHFFLLVLAVSMQIDIAQAKPLLRAAIAAKTIGELKSIITSGGALGDFFVYNAATNSYTSPQAAGITLDLNAACQPLMRDAAQISIIKTAYNKSSSALVRKDLPRILGLIDKYQNYLLYFLYNGQKIYINNPLPQVAPAAIGNIIKKWNP
jgi:hypothetical protein